jgi:hypothetical protein
MAYDEELADRIRTFLGDRAGLTEQKMFGGLARRADGDARALDGGLAPRRHGRRRRRRCVGRVGRARDSLRGLLPRK